MISPGFKQACLCRPITIEFIKVPLELKKNFVRKGEKKVTSESEKF